MATITFAQALSKYRIAVTPILRRRGAASWLAGQRVLNGDGITNIIHPERKVEGRETPEDALRDLLVLIGSEDTLVGDDAVPDLHPNEDPEAVQIPESKPMVVKAPVADDPIVEENGRFFLRLPDGREYQASRKRDLIRRAKQIGALA